MHHLNVAHNICLFSVFLSLHSAPIFRLCVMQPFFFVPVFCARFFLSLYFISVSCFCFLCMFSLFLFFRACFFAVFFVYVSYFLCFSLRKHVCSADCTGSRRRSPA
jgi:hypothetical protein